MKLKCENCGEIIESGIINCMNHHYDDCKSRKEEYIPGFGTGVYLPPMNFTPIEEIKNNNNESNLHDTRKDGKQKDSKKEYPHSL